MLTFYSMFFVLENKNVSRLLFKFMLVKGEKCAQSLVALREWTADNCGRGKSQFSGD